MRCFGILPASTVSRNQRVPSADAAPRAASRLIMCPAALTGSDHSPVNAFRTRQGGKHACVCVFLTQQHFPLSDSLIVSKLELILVGEGRRGR